MPDLTQFLADVAEYATENRKQADLIDLLAHFTVDTALADQQRAGAATLRTLAEGWDEMPNLVKGSLTMLAVAAHNITVSVQTLAWILGTACPILTAVITKENAPLWLKAVLNAALATVAGLLAVAIKANGHLDADAWLLAIGNSMIVAFATYASFLRHTVTPAVARWTAGVGVGRAKTA